MVSFKEQKYLEQRAIKISSIYEAYKDKEMTLTVIEGTMKKVSKKMLFHRSVQHTSNSSYFPYNFAN